MTNVSLGIHHIKIYNIFLIKNELVLSGNFYID
jgi:hypothetical protein